MATRPSFWKQLRHALGAAPAPAAGPEQPAPKVKRKKNDRQSWQALRATHCHDVKNPLWLPHCGTPVPLADQGADSCGSSDEGDGGGCVAAQYPEPEIFSPLFQHFGAASQPDTEPRRTRRRKKQKTAATATNPAAPAAQQGLLLCKLTTPSETRSSSSQGLSAEVSAASSEKPTAASSPHSPPAAEDAAQQGPLVPPRPPRPNADAAGPSPRGDADRALCAPQSPREPLPPAARPKKRSASVAPWTGGAGGAKGGRSRSCPRLADRNGDEPLGLTLEEKPVVGMVVTETIPEGICRRCGVEPGDVLRTWDGLPLRVNADLEVVKRTTPGATVALVVTRRGEPVAIDLSFVGTPEYPRPVLGLKLQEEVVSHCLVATAVLPASRAGRAGACVGDVVEAWNGIPLRSLADLRDHYRHTAAALLVRRNGEPLTLQLPGKPEQRRSALAPQAPAPAAAGEGGAKAQFRTLYERLRALRSCPEVNQLAPEDPESCYTETATDVDGSETDTDTDTGSDSDSAEAGEPAEEAKPRRQKRVRPAGRAKAPAAATLDAATLQKNNPREALERVRQKHLQLLQKLQKYDNSGESEEAAASGSDSEGSASATDSRSDSEGSSRDED